MIARLAGTMVTASPSFTATVVLPNVGMKSADRLVDADLAFFDERPGRRCW